MINEHNIYTDNFKQNRIYISNFGDFLYLTDRSSEFIGICYMFVYSSNGNRQSYISYCQCFNRYIKEVGNVHI